MKNTPILFLSIIIFCGTFFACSSDDEAPQAMTDTNEPLEALVEFNVSYGDDPQQVYDIYLPEGRDENKTKVIILIHGGGWIEGDKADVTEFIDLVRDNNPDHAIVNINYRLAIIPSRAAFPNQFEDLDAVINKLTEERETLQIKPDFGLIGLSAGAHIALQYDSVYDTDNQVKFVCDIVGPTNFTDPFYADNPNFSTLINFLVDEDAYPNGTDFVTELSPALRVSPSTSPTILFYGNQDELVPLTNGQSLQASLDANGIVNEFTIYDGGHGDWDQPSFLDLETKVAAFINAHLKIE